MIDMEAYYIEGLFLPRHALKKPRPAGQEVEPFARSIWANSPEEAVQIATQELGGGQWVEAPKVSRTSETQWMRAMGAPELPGLGTKPPKKKGKR
jgi:hypothetical protein